VNAVENVLDLKLRSLMQRTSISTQDTSRGVFRHNICIKYQCVT